LGIVPKVHAVWPAPSLNSTLSGSLVTNVASTLVGAIRSTWQIMPAPKVSFAAPFDPTVTVLSHAMGTLDVTWRSDEPGGRSSISGLTFAATESLVYWHDPPCALEEW